MLGNAQSRKIKKYKGRVKVKVSAYTARLGVLKQVCRLVYN
jgi:hypothetical protein